ncbi:MAG: MarC family protein [Labilithrix sp.]|nr:MarC family protein [Labilithrix sp.]MCW5810624.1 MarC family protein [Labilithrix sp.]
MGAYTKSFLLLFMLLNPFLMSVYLLDLIHDLRVATFVRVLARGAVIAGSAFCFFAWTGDAIFSDYLQVRFASFQVFGGIVFLIIGVRFVFEGVQTIRKLRGPVEHVAGSIALPFMIGPGTVSASVVIGARLPLAGAIAVIVIVMLSTVLLLFLLKLVHDRVKVTNARLTERYLEVVGRISALLIGTFSVEMILDGVTTWLKVARIIGRA